MYAWDFRRHWVFNVRKLLASIPPTSKNWSSMVFLSVAWRTGLLMLYFPTLKHKLYSFSSELVGILIIEKTSSVSIAAQMDFPGRRKPKCKKLVCWIGVFSLWYGMMIQRSAGVLALVGSPSLLKKTCKSLNVTI